MTSDGPAAPDICGTVTGQHMIVEARDDCNEVSQESKEFVPPDHFSSLH